MQGESPLLEFKSSFRWDLEQDRINRALETVVLKTIAGYLNSSTGGTLLIGVADNGEIIGLEKDYQSLKRQDQDGYEQALITAISTHLGADLCQFVKILFHVIDGKHVCRLIVLASPRPVFLNQGKTPKFYLRTGGGTRDLNIQEAVEFIAHRWHR
jgi:predicted HTH transcriptional regulator